MSKSSSIIPLVLIGGVGYYLYKEGYFSSIFGGTVTGSLLPAPASTTPSNVTPITVIPPAQQVLDLTGLVTRPDVNDSLTGTVKINGTPTTLSVIKADGRIFDTSGQEVTQVLVNKGVDVNALRAAFLGAQGLSGLGVILNWQDFFNLQPHKKFITGNFR